MPTLSLRILIADSQHLQRLSIEKILNQYGYHRVAPIASLEELLTVIQYALEPFELLVINSALMVGSGHRIEDFCRNCPSILNALIYDGHAMQFFVMKGEGQIIKKLSGVPDSDSIKNIMSLIDKGRQGNFLYSCHAFE
ncbi:response regulator [Pseudomonas chlororaphis]|uniref:response regulator n=1 Tax=Pseudomonas chlororaphis TaxID=587753 RepID=UPI002408077B|nr:response regulator [Pseudomonas chlororaphis]